MRDKYLNNVSKITFYEEKCTGCGKCIEVCPHEVFKQSDGKVYLSAKNACMECGACSKNCPFNAIYVKSGVGCASAVISGWIKGTEPSCDCSGSSSGDCC